MKIENLQIELRPRTNAQALDLGHTLLRSHPAAAYLSFAVLWWPLIIVGMVLTWYIPRLDWLWLLIAWWFRPLFERAPLYVLSRKVFGDSVTWQEALRAWPRQLGGGWFRLLTWARLISSGRAMYQPVWQLEGARGKVASLRRQILGRKETTSSAFFFGVIFLFLEIFLLVGMMGFVSIFFGDGQMSNPLALFDLEDSASHNVFQIVYLLLFGISTTIMAPIYTACGFTLYLNRRASLEAWDIEMQLRQIQRPVAAKARARPAAAAAAVAAACLPLLLAVLVSAAAPDVLAAQVQKPKQPQCKPLALAKQSRAPAQSPAQARLRKQIDALYKSEALRGYECVEAWHYKFEADKKRANSKDRDDPNLAAVAGALKVLVIAAAIGVLGWLLFRYRHRFPRFSQAAPMVAATEVGGLDIRAASLPSEVGAEARRLWLAGERRGALGLLYRATLARLVADNRLQIGQGYTEGDCLGAASKARGAGTLGAERMALASEATRLWLAAAYGDRWPVEATVFAHCDNWDAEFGQGKEARP